MAATNDVEIALEQVEASVKGRMKLTLVGKTVEASADEHILALILSLNRGLRAGDKTPAQVEESRKANSSRNWVILALAMESMLEGCPDPNPTADTSTAEKEAAIARREKARKPASVCLEILNWLTGFGAAGSTAEDNANFTFSEDMTSIMTKIAQRKKFPNALAWLLSPHWPSLLDVSVKEGDSLKTQGGLPKLHRRNAVQKAALNFMTVSLSPAHNNKKGVDLDKSYGSSDQVMKALGLLLSGPLTTEDGEIDLGVLELVVFLVTATAHEFTADSILAFLDAGGLDGISALCSKHMENPKDGPLKDVIYLVLKAMSRTLMCVEDHTQKADTKKDVKLKLQTALDRFLVPELVSDPLAAAALMQSGDESQKMVGVQATAFLLTHLVGRSSVEVKSNGKWGKKCEQAMAVLITAKGGENVTRTCAKTLKAMDDVKSKPFAKLISKVITLAGHEWVSGALKTADGKVFVESLAEYADPSKTSSAGSDSNSDRVESLLGEITVDMANMTVTHALVPKAKKGAAKGASKESLRCHNPACTQQEKWNAASLKKCGGCKKVSYCGPDCAKADWKAHKKACKAAQGK